MIEEMERYAKENNVPIMLSDGIEYLTKFIQDNNIKSILEIGTAIGYSAIKMAMVNNRGLRSLRTKTFRPSSDENVQNYQGRSLQVV